MESQSQPQETSVEQESKPGEAVDNAPKLTKNQGEEATKQKMIDQKKAANEKAG
jgi:hypothetical protein